MEIIEISILLIICGLILILILLYISLCVRKNIAIRYNFPIVLEEGYDSESINSDIPECVICHNPLDMYIITSCNHKFHILCIRKWYKSQLENNIDPTCPICRAPLINNDPIDQILFT